MPFGQYSQTFSQEVPRGVHVPIMRSAALVAGPRAIRERDDVCMLDSSSARRHYRVREWLFDRCALPDFIFTSPRETQVRQPTTSSLLTRASLEEVRSPVRRRAGPRAVPSGASRPYVAWGPLRIVSICASSSLESFTPDARAFSLTCSGRLAPMMGAAIGD